MFCTWILIFLLNQICIKQVICENKQGDISTTSWRKQVGSEEQKNGIAARQAGATPLIIPPENSGAGQIIPEQGAMPQVYSQPATAVTSTTQHQQQPVIYAQVPSSNSFQWPHQVTQTLNPGIMQMLPNRPIFYPYYSQQTFQPSQQNTGTAKFQINQGNPFSHPFGPNQQPFQSPSLHGGIEFSYPQYIPISVSSRPISLQPPVFPWTYWSPSFSPLLTYSPMVQNWPMYESNVAGADGPQLETVDTGVMNAQSEVGGGDLSFQGVNSEGTNNGLGSLGMDANNNLMTSASDDVTMTGSQPQSEDPFNTKPTQPVLGMNPEVGDSSSTMMTGGLETTAINQANSVLSSSAMINNQQHGDRGIDQVQNLPPNGYILGQASTPPVSNFQSSDQDVVSLSTANQNDAFFENAANTFSNGATLFQSGSYGGPTFDTGSSSSVIPSDMESIDADLAQIAMGDGSGILNGVSIDNSNADGSGSYVLNYAAEETQLPTLEISSGSVGTGVQINSGDIGLSIGHEVLGHLGIDTSLGSGQAYDVKSGSVGDNAEAGLGMGEPLVNGGMASRNGEGGDLYGVTSPGVEGGHPLTLESVGSVSEGAVGIGSSILNAASSDVDSFALSPVSSSSSSSAFSAVQSSSPSQFFSGSEATTSVDGATSKDIGSTIYDGV